MPPLYQRIFYLNERMSKYVCIYLDDETVALRVKIHTRSNHVVLNKTVVKTCEIRRIYDGVHKIVDPNYNLLMYCGQFIRLECNAHKCFYLNRVVVSHETGE
jgi:hypothetical protein